MKKITLSTLLLLFTFSLFSQTSEYSCIISRDNYDQFHLVNANKDTLFISIDSLDDRILESALTYKIIRGKGRTKDNWGFKERKKKYLVSSNQDTLLSLFNNNTFLLTVDSIPIERERTPNGWVYYYENDSLPICEVDLHWNEASWQYTVRNYEEGNTIDLINKAVQISMVNMAYHRSKCECDDEETNFWFIMYLAALALPNR